MGHASTANLAPDISSDPVFRAWGSAISGKFAAMGLVQTADSGQINWTTVTVPGTSTTAAGYEIWRFADALQATLPVFFKIEYGRGTGSAGALWLTIGTGSNGSGTLTGSVNTRVIITSSFQTTTALCVFSGDTNRVGVVLWKSVAMAVAFFIERGKDATGADNNIILFTYFDSTRSQGFQQWGNQAGWQTGLAGTNIMPPQPDTRTTGVDGSGTTIAFYAHLHSNAGGFLNAGMCIVGYFNADVVQDTTFVLSMYGSPHTFYALGGNTYLTNCSRRQINNNMRLAMRYE